MPNAGIGRHTQHPTAFRFPVLIGDIGGTNARFGLIADRDAPLEVFRPVATADFHDIESAVKESVYAYTALRPRTAVIDLAGPVVGDAVDLTNAHWVVRPKDMIGRLGLEEVLLLNDFEAQALSLTALDADALVPIGDAAGQGQGAKAVLGPGTGLGVGALVDAGGIWVPVPGEGGHVALGPAEPDEFPLWANIEPEHGRISAEALLCGRGLTRLYRAVARTDGREAPLSDPAEITKAGLGGSDPVAAKTLAFYCRLLGRLAGDVALTFMARGGVYLGGGISPRILPVLLQGEFRRAFEAKAPHEALMARIPTWVIVAENPALLGLATFARSPEVFGVNLSGRRWLHNDETATIRDNPVPPDLSPDALKAAFGLTDQVAIVTGGSSGIGRAAAVALGAAGCKIVINHLERSSDEAEEVVAEIADAGGTAAAIAADVSDETDVEEMFAETVRRFGTVHILVNNAGIQSGAQFAEMTYDQWRKVLSVNLDGQFLCARAAVREFLRRGPQPDVSRATGKIVCMSSVHQLIPWACEANYAASKGGVMLMMQSLAQELAHEKIRVNAVAPGAIRTKINQEAWESEEAMSGLLKLMPYGRIGEPPDVAQTVLFLASDLSDYVTGATVYVDGGMTLYPAFRGAG